MNKSQLPVNVAASDSAQTAIDEPFPSQIHEHTRNSSVQSRIRTKTQG